MNCDDFKERISERVAGELTQEKEKEFDSHEQTCRPCRDAMRDWQQMESWLRTGWPSQDPPVPYSLSVSKTKGNWLDAMQRWASAASMAVVAITLLVLALFRPSIQLHPHQLLVNFGGTASQSGAMPVEAVSPEQVRAFVQAAVEQSMAEQSVRSKSPFERTGNSLNDEEARRFAQLGVQLEMLKESQASLWQQVQQHGLYLESAFLASAGQIRPDQKPSTQRQ